MTTPTRILVDHAGTKGMGDVVCELNVYATLRRKFPTARLYSRNSRTLAWGHPDIDGFDQHSSCTAFDQVYHLPGLTDLVRDYRTALQEGRTVFEHFLRHQGFPGPTEPPVLYVLPREMDALGLEDDGTGGLIIGYSTDSKDLDRRWGEERFTALVRYLEEAYGASLIELGSGMSSGHTGLGLDLVGQTSLRQTMAILSLCDLFIGNHGGLTHLAGGVGTPILSPWGASTPYAAYAYDEVSVALQTAPPCRHCNWTLERIEGCLHGNFLRDRSPCTQEISLEAMVAAADALVPTLIARQAELKAARDARRQKARDPLTLERFDLADEISPDTRLHLLLGGTPAWGADHGRDNFERLTRLVAFPDWHRPDSWQPLLETYVRHARATDPVVLMLSASPLTGSEVKDVLGTYLFEILGAPSVPKLALIVGALEAEERYHLVDRAAAHLPLESAYDRDRHPTGTPALTGPEQLAEFLAQLLGR